MDVIPSRARSLPRWDIRRRRMFMQKLDDVRSVQLSVVTCSHEELYVKPST